MSTFQPVKDPLYCDWRFRLPPIKEKFKKIFVRRLTKATFRLSNNVWNLFYALSHLFLQFYKLYGFTEGQMFPHVYSFMSDKSQTTYKCLFRLLRLKALQYNNNNIHPALFRRDYEKGDHNALQEVFLNTEVRG